MQREPSDRTRSFTSSNTLLFIILAIFIVSAVITAYLAFTQVKGWLGFSNPDGVADFVLDEDALSAYGGDDNQLNIGGPTPRVWNKDERVNMLLIGVDNKDWEIDGGYPRTDTIIVVSIDPQSNSASALSIPRDLWVEVPGLNSHKINQAYPLGIINKVEGGGAGMLIRTVENLLSVSIHFYAEIDFNTFVTMIDEIEGVKVDVPFKLQVDLPGDGPETIKVLKPGVQTLTGELALAYARNRSTIGSDFDRMERQQQILMSIRDRVTSFDMIPALIRKAPSLLTQLSSGINTNLGITQMVEMALIANKIPRENIFMKSIGSRYVTPSYSWDGQDILLPNPEAMLTISEMIFNPPQTSVPPQPTTEGITYPPPETQPTQAPLPTIPQDMAGKLIDENAILSIQNGTATAGLAAGTTRYLENLGFIVGEITNADQLYDLTTIIDFRGSPYTIEFLIDVMTISPHRVFHRYDPDSPVDIAVILGNDWASNNPIP